VLAGVLRCGPDVYDRPMRARWLPLTVVLLLTVGGGTAVAAAAPPAFGPAEGVQATRATDGSVELRFAGPAAVLDGHDLDVDCGIHRESVGLLFTGRGVTLNGDSNTYSANGTVSPAGILRVEIGTSRPLDGCELRDGTTIVARAAFDTAGAVWADEAPRALGLRDLLVSARTAAAYRPAAALVGGAVVALDGPAAIAPAGQFGYWTDGTAHAVATTTSAAGRVLTIEDLGDGLLRSDVIDQGRVLDALFGVVFNTDTLGAIVLTAQGKAPATSPYRGAPLDAGDGIRARFAGRRLTVRFTGRAAAVARKLVGRRLRVVCVVRPSRGLFGGALHSLVAHTGGARLPRHGGSLSTTLRGAGDACLLFDADRLVAYALPTDAGRRWRADVLALDRLDRLPDSLAAPGGHAYLTTAAIVAAHRDLTALSGPDAAVAPGRVGVWTDGARHAVVATTSSSGRRFVMADEGGGMLRTNIFSEFVGLVLLDQGALSG
jgi:hypothetical protein